MATTTLDTRAAQRLLERARRYVEQETPSRNETALAELSKLIESELKNIGADVQSFDAPGLGRNLLAEVAGREAIAPVVVLAHIDTVHPLGTLTDRPFRVEDGRAYGPGIYDMKSGLATAVEALVGLRERGEQPRRPVRLVITCDEEIGSHSARALIEQEARGAAAVLVPEPCIPNGGAKTFRKGVATYRMMAYGRAAHAGIEGESAVSATVELVHALAGTIALARHDRGTTINVGLIGGGTASNVVPAEAWAVIDVRLAQDGEAERINTGLMALRARHPDARIEVVLTENRPPLIRNEAVARLYYIARDLALELGFELPEGGTGGGSDGSLAAAVGAAVLDGLGPRGAGAHAIDEHIIIADLPFRLALMTRLFQRL